MIEEYEHGFENIDKQRCEIKRHCPYCGTKLYKAQKTDWGKKRYLFHCHYCNKFFRVQYVIVEYKPMTRIIKVRDTNEN